MKAIIIKITLTLSCLLCAFGYINAQNATAPWSIGLSGGKAAYNGDLGNGFFNFTQNYQGLGGLKIARYINPSFDISLDGTYGRYGYWDTPTDQFLSNMLQGNLSLDYKFNNGYIMPEDAIIAPYLFAGLGVANIKSVNDSRGDIRATDGTDVYVPLGLGANINFTPNVSAFWQATYGLNFSDDRDMRVADNNDQFLLNQVGVKFNIGSSGGIDSDGDGITDNKDACPDAPGLAQHKGCPDSDGDGLIDRADECPDIAGTRKNKGCPDSDGDGIIDKADKCPDVAGSAMYRGCPNVDSDGDGVRDDVDQCPDTPGTRSNKGCPIKVVDTDGDGIANTDDQCPNAAGPASNGGCPIIKITEEAQTVFQEALRGIQFETAKAVIKTSSYPILDNVVRVMQNNPQYQLSIEGHTDSQGSETSNLNLSQRRADAVKLYLTNNGIAATRMTTLGYGEAVPVADNNSPEGRALNRRVEFKVTF